MKRLVIPTNTNKGKEAGTLAFTSLKVEVQPSHQTRQRKVPERDGAAHDEAMRGENEA
jgi:hypothetical protein